jgi:hypothetical protein
MSKKTANPGKKACIDDSGLYNMFMSEICIICSSLRAVLGLSALLLRL